MIKQTVLGIALIIISNVAISAPVYLECVVSGENGTINFSVKLDESNGKVTHTSSGGSSFNTEGFFEANRILYKDVLDAGIILTFKYSINRSTLAAHHVLETKSSNTSSDTSTSEMNGKCDIVEVAKRKI